MIIKPFATQEKFIKAALSGKYSVIYFGGAIRGGKTFAGLLAILALARVYPRSRWLVVRKDYQRLRLTTIPSFYKILPDAAVSGNVCKLSNGSEIIFFAENYDRDKDLNRFRGLEINGALLEEANELQELTFIKVQERVGTHIIEPMPKPLILLTSNPDDNWVKLKFYDRWKRKELPAGWGYIPSRLSDNPHIPKEVVDNYKHLPAEAYKRFVEGDWEVKIQVPDPFYHAFDTHRHLVSCEYNPDLPLHLSVDENVEPYMAATVYQIISADTVHMIDFIPAKNVEHLCREFTARYYFHTGAVFLYGDATSQRRSARVSGNLYTLIENYLERYKVINRVLKSNPPHHARWLFVNDCLEKDAPVRLRFDKSLMDVEIEMLTVRYAPDGSKMKEKIRQDGKTFEKNGHISDTLDYFLVSAFNDAFRSMTAGKNKVEATLERLSKTKTKNPLL